MTEQLIPLSSFVDTSNPLLPIGHLTMGGLNSAMNNPLISKSNLSINYRSQIVFNSRLRDLPEWAINIETARCAKLGSQSYGTGWKRDDEGGGDDGVVRTGYYDGFITAENWNILGSYDKIVYSTAIKILRTTPWESNTRPSTKFGFESAANGKFYLIGPNYGDNRFFARYLSTTGDPWYNLFTINEDSYNKWLLFLITFKKNDITKCNIYVKGGQFAEMTSFNASSFPGFNSNMTDAQKISSPGGSGAWGGFASMAAYSGENDAGVDGLSPNNVEWNLFDSEHECGSCTIEGNSIVFSCTGEVAWDVKVNGIWCNSRGYPLNTQKSNRYFYETGEHLININKMFTEIRPVLFNSGNLNADNLSILNRVSTMNKSRHLNNRLKNNIFPLIDLGNKIKRLSISG